MGLINIYDNRELVVLRLGTLLKGPTFELREDINDEITQVVDLKDEESEKCDPKRKHLHFFGHSFFLSFQKMSRPSHIEVWSGLTCAVLTAFW